MYLRGEKFFLCTRSLFFFWKTGCAYSLQKAVSVYGIINWSLDYFPNSMWLPGEMKGPSEGKHCYQKLHSLKTSDLEVAHPDTNCFLLDGCGFDLWKDMIESIMWSGRNWTIYYCHTNTILIQL